MEVMFVRHRCAAAVAQKRSGSSPATALSKETLRTNRCADASCRWVICHVMRAGIGGAGDNMSGERNKMATPRQK